MGRKKREQRFSWCTEVLQVAGWCGLGRQQSDSGVKTWKKERDWGRGHWRVRMEEKEGVSGDKGHVQVPVGV